MKDKDINKGTHFMFLDDLRNFQKSSHRFKYMVLIEGILDMNGSYSVIIPTGKLLSKEILVLDP